MANTLPTVDTLLNTVGRFSKERFSKEQIDLWEAEFDQYERDVDAFVGTLIPDDPSGSEPAKLTTLQRGMLAHLLKTYMLDNSVTPSELADALGERNRKTLRAAGRLLAAKGLVDVIAEPCDSPEGERVLAYELRVDVADALEAHLDVLDLQREAAAGTGIETTS
jgi:hypothetical protein